MMDHSALSQAEEDALIGQIIRTKVRRLVREGRVPETQSEDLEQGIWLHWTQQRPRFDPARGNLQAFAAVLVRHCASNLVGRDTNSKRNPRQCVSLSTTTTCDGEATEWSQLIRQDDLDRRLGRVTRSEQERLELAIDLEDVFETLPLNLRALARYLGQMSITEVAAKLGRPRTTVQSQVSKLRSRCEDAGLQKYLE